MLKLKARRIAIAVRALRTLMSPLPVNEQPAFGRYEPRGLVSRLLAWTHKCSFSWFGRRRAFLLRAVGVRLLRGRPLDVTALGARMRLYPYNNVCEKRILFTPQYFEAAERALIASRIHADFRFIDVGSNVGGYALYVAAKAGPRARILAIEPQPEMFERLIYNIRQNAFVTVKALNCALADRDGEVTLFIDARNRGETSMRIIYGHGGGDLRAPAKSLETVLREEQLDRVDAMKLDVQGAEDVILEPFLRVAPREQWPRLLLIEFLRHRSTSNLPQILSAAGYREVLRTRANIAYELVDAAEERA